MNLFGLTDAALFIKTTRSCETGEMNIAKSILEFSKELRRPWNTNF